MLHIVVIATEVVGVHTIPFYDQLQVLHQSGTMFSHRHTREEEKLGAIRTGNTCSYHSLNAIKHEL